MPTKEYADLRIYMNFREKALSKSEKTGENITL